MRFEPLRLRGRDPARPDVDESVALAHRLGGEGVALVDCPSGA
jgi:hypothetical protein